jgi:hypothetical protein
MEQLLLKLEEDQDYIYSMAHKIKSLEDDCTQKDLEIEKMSSDMQEALTECRMEAEEMAEDMLTKIASEVRQRHDTEKVVFRLEAECSRLQVSNFST